MPTFEYTALSSGGQRVSGEIAGANEQAVLSELEARRLVPVSIREKVARGLRVRRGVSVRALANAYQQLADMLHAGVPMLRALRLLGSRKSQPMLSRVFREMADAVAEGEDLGDAMARRPDVFRQVQVAMVRAGEKGGFLDAAVARLGQFLLAQAELRSKVIGSLVYPCALVVFGVAVLGFIFGVFVPMFRPIFNRLPNVPLVTQVVFAASDAVGRYGLVTLAVVAVLVVGGMWAARRPDVRRVIARVKTHGPIFGPLVRALATARFCRMLGTMLANGVPMLSAMSTAREAAGNLLLEEAVEEAIEGVRAGEALAPPLRESGLFADDVIEMIAVGEEAGNVAEVLVTVAETIEKRIDRLLSTVVRLIEPLLLVVIAVVVLIVAVGLILPLTQLSDIR